MSVIRWKILKGKILKGVSFTYSGGAPSLVGLPGNVEVEEFEGGLTQVPCTCSNIHSSVGLMGDIRCKVLWSYQDVLSTFAIFILQEM